MSTSEPDGARAKPSVYLVRHGEVHNPDHLVYSDLPGFVLSDRGRAQAEATSAWLSSRAVARVVSSPLDRARETAAILARPHGLTPEIDPDLTEWRMLHRWRGQTWESVEVERPEELDRYLHDPLDLPWATESLEDLARRVVAAIERAAASNTSRPGATIVVGHQDPIQAARLVLTHRSLASLGTDKPRHAEAFGLAGGRQWRELSRWTPPQED
jgi:broad specificity phosphatase PhoE